MKTDGPKITIKASCFDCRHCESKSYYIEDGNSEDSGFDVFCALVENRRIGDTTWDTPAWCPLLAKAKADAGIGGPTIIRDRRPTRAEVEAATIGPRAHFIHTKAGDPHPKVLWYDLDKWGKVPKLTDDGQEMIGETWIPLGADGLPMRLEVK